jgi:hypothetical protein
MTDDTPFAGLSRRECCTGCTPERCILSEAAQCIHPAKGGMQAHHTRDPALVRRFDAAQELLRGSHAKVA